MDRLTHTDENGHAQMVDVSGKDVTVRTAVATGKIYMKKETVDLIAQGNIPKGDVLSTARIAGIMAAKNTSGLIPLCHSLPIDMVTIDFEILEDYVNITAFAKCSWKTGVEMEAITAVSIACVTIYDMCKAVDKRMVISDIRLESKTGGKSGDFKF